ncbi:TolB-like translocation protein [Pareuzebyella sediminis]|uniref:PD40 domain-containing protein n=1 Tax=Pareuzebyella sediminis TaxID=2607998 RepID=UPI0011EDCCA7|nr:PD40 domain-containing protein [Pareuzebyella sediminis]
MAFSLQVVAQDSLVIETFHDGLDDFVSIRDLALSKDANEAFFTIQDVSGSLSQIVRMCKKNGQWSSPELLSFNDGHSYLEPFLSVDEKKLFFVSNRPRDTHAVDEKNFDIWYVTRSSKKGPWSEPINLGPAINTSLDEFYPSLSNNNNLYFTLDAPKGMGKDDIYFAKWNGKGYDAPQLLNKNINSGGYEFNAFIAPDESFLLYTKYNTEDGLGSGDLYISRKNASGHWEPAHNVGAPINSKYMEYCPYYDEVNKTLYFTSKRNSLVMKDFKNIEELKQYLNHGENGISKIYKVKIDLEKRYLRNK